MARGHKAMSPPEADQPVAESPQQSKARPVGQRGMELRPGDVRTPWTAAAEGTERSRWAGGRVRAGAACSGRVSLAQMRLGGACTAHHIATFARDSAALGRWRLVAPSLAARGRARRSQIRWDGVRGCPNRSWDLRLQSPSHPRIPCASWAISSRTRTRTRTRTRSRTRTRHWAFPSGCSVCFVGG
jgi:hypothetical protein